MSERKCYTCGGERGNWYYIGDVRRWNRCRSCAGSGWVFGERAEHHDMLERAETRRNGEDLPGANMYRYNPDNDYSPGNFRRPTLEKCSDYLNWWADQGVTKLSDLNTFDMTPEERALDKIRWSEAKYYWDRYQKQLGRHDTDTYVYRKPPFSVPKEDAEDYGDFEAVSVKAAQNYLYNFFTRQAERTEAGLPLQDVELYPWKPRYDECISILGQDEVDRIEQNIFDRAELVLYRKNPGACATCGLTNCPCGCDGDPSLCTCRRRRNPGYYDSMADTALSYAYSKPRRNLYRERPSMPW